MIKRSLPFYAAGLVCLLAATNAFAQKKYGPGVTDTEIKIGHNMPLSGPASAYSLIGKVQDAYIKVLNDKGGINGRKINLLTRDDGYSPPKTLEITRQLVEDDQVLAIVSPFGTAPNIAIQKYLNEKQVPQLLAQTSSERMNDPKNFPWTTPYSSFGNIEAEIFANFILKTMPNAKIGILAQADDIGKDYIKGLRAGLGDKANSMIVKEATNQVTDPTVDSQVLILKDAGADVIFMATTAKFGAQAIRKIHELGWKPQILLTSPINSVNSVLEPAGLEASKGAVTALYFKTVGDPAWDNDKGVKDYVAFMKENFPSVSPNDTIAFHGFTAIEMAVEILRRSGDDLTRENVIKQATNLKGFAPSLLLPGITIQTNPKDFTAITQMQFAKFDGKGWALFGGIIDKPAAK